MRCVSSNTTPLHARTALTTTFVARRVIPTNVHLRLQLLLPSTLVVRATNVGSSRSFFWRREESFTVIRLVCSFERRHPNAPNWLALIGLSVGFTLFTRSTQLVCAHQPWLLCGYLWWRCSC